jgi:predicted ATPase/class 3 adenylate cyclase
MCEIAGVDLPTGTLSFLFTDIEGSTRLLDALGVAYDELLEVHRDIIRSSVEEHDGVVFGIEGDAVFAVFVSAGDAVAAAARAQRRLTAHPWPDGGIVRVRMAVHTDGDVRRSGQGYVGMALHVTARVCAAGHGGQVLLTGSTRALVPACEVRDLGEHRLKDLTDPVHIGHLLGDGLATSFPPLRAMTALTHNLPASTDAFIGRTAELADVMSGLTAHRLVTLTGTGGSGKTRLALEVAGGLLASFGDGAWLVELAPVSDESRVPALVASVVGVGERSGEPVLASLVEWVRSHDVLLVIDNCEHLVDGVAEFVDNLLRSCPDVRILATSRELLGVRGELALHLAPLRLDGEATELFLARAIAVVPGFDRDAVDLELIEQVCRRLDGLPLAIELAVARLRSLSLSELASRLDDRFRLLTGGSRTNDSRQRTLEAVVAWSYELLPEAERELFRAVSVFAGSFTIEAAAAISGGDVFGVIDTLGRLVEKSLVLRVELGAGADRYQLLETLRQYARDRLTENAEVETRSAALLSWALTYVDDLERDMRTPRMDAALAAARPERNNLRAAMEWAIGQGQLTSALRLVSNVPLGLTSERRSLIADLLARGADGHPAIEVARAQLTLSDLAFEQGDMAAAVAAAAAAKAGFDDVGDRHAAAWSLLDMVWGSWGAGEAAEVDQLLRECLRAFRALDDDFGLAQPVWIASLREPDPAAAAVLAAEAERRFRDLESPSMVAHAVEGRALIEINAGHLAAAAPLLREAIAFFLSVGNQGCAAHSLEAVAVWAATRGDRGAAAELVGAADILREVSGAGHKPWEVRARHSDYDAWVIGDSPGARKSVARGRLHSLGSAVALADGVLTAAPEL